jgi:sugar/nucleoside kinase (ribokinase family)
MAKIITGVGAAVLDHLNLIEDYPNEDGSTHITQVISQGGGACATAVVAAKRLGMYGQIVSSVGDDETGKMILDGLDREGIDTTMVEIIPGGISPHSEIMVNPQTGTRTKFVCNNTLPPIEWNNDQIALLKNSDILHVDGTRYDNAMAAIKLAKQFGIPVSVDGCHMEEDKQLNRTMAEMADILIMNARYPKIVAGTATTEEALAYFASHGPKVVISTQGTKGCLAWIDGRIEVFPAYSVKAVDSTGAGDVFHGAFIAAYMRGYDVRQAIRYASIAAALKCTQVGGRAGIPSDQEIVSYL